VIGSVAVRETEKQFEVGSLLLKRWRALAVFGALGIVGGIVYALLAPEWYEARLTAVPTRQNQTFGMDVASRLPTIPGLDSSLANDVRRIEAVLTSNSVSDEVITKFNLMDRYGVAHIENARTSLWSHCSTTVEWRSSLVILRCEDRSPQLARDIVQYFGEVGNRVFRRISTSSSKEERQFLETQVQEVKRKVDAASRALREFQEKYKLVDLAEQSKAVISAMASIKGEMISKQLELSYLSGFSGRGESNVMQLQQQISIMDSKLRQLEDQQVGTHSGSAAGAASDFFPSAMSVPKLRFELEELYREQKIQETVFTLLTQRYEMAKVDEARTTSTFQILDAPTLPTLKSRPKRRKIVALGGMAGLGLGVAFVLFPAWIRRRRAIAPSP
jgi:tyrosine-protein kinase Etk/Wzc